jgi:hypothetical protein
MEEQHRMHNAFAKSAVNRFLSRNYLPLTVEERLHFIAASGIGRFHVRADAITGAATKIARPDRRTPSNFYKHNVINYEPLNHKPISGWAQFGFIADILAGKGYADTELYKRFEQGETFTRVVDAKPHRKRITIQSRDDFETYHASCVSLMDSIRKHGFLDIEHGEDSDSIREIRNAHGDGRGTTIGVAIDDEGKLLHRSQGHHRMAVAYLLRIDRIPVTVNYISGAYFRAFSSRTDVLSERRFISVVQAAARAAIAQHQ